MRAPGSGSCLLVVLLVLAALLSTEAGYITANEELLVGWRGEVPREASELLYDPLITRNASDLPTGVPLPASKGWIEQVSWQPRVFIWHNFITDREAKHIIKLAAPQMKRSTVVGAGGKSVEDNYRTSYGTFLRRYQDAIVERIENKVAAWTHIPVEHQEDIQVLRYGIGQQYKVHADTLRDNEAGVRVATVIVYLNEPGGGGETAFPDSQWIHPDLEATYGAGASACAKGHVAVRPKAGDAVLFWSIDPNGQTEDHHASHTGCPVLALPAKWTMTKWIHAKPFRAIEVHKAMQLKGVKVHDLDPGVCKDALRDCPDMAKRGECDKNYEYMVVNVAGPGYCRLSCGACSVCPAGDLECYNKNRSKVGYLTIDPAEVHTIVP